MLESRFEMGRRMEPIRDLKLLEEFKSRLMDWNIRNWLLFVLGINTGLRVSDILPLRVKDILGRTHFDIREKKTHKLRRILITDTIRAYVDYYLSVCPWLTNDDYLFESQRKGRPISTVQAWRILSEVGLSLGLENIGTHTMRKTFGYHFYKRTKDIATLKTILNHTTERMTMLYIGLIQESIDEALEDFNL
ncbi:Tyrosine recombinase XerD [compost metagenome]